MDTARVLEDHFGPEIAHSYDEAVAAMFGPAAIEHTVDVLVQLAGPAAALALASRGGPGAGIELSEAMVQQLRAKPGGADLRVVIGDMAGTRVPGRFGLVYLVFNTIGNLTTQEQQVACFANAAAHLAPGGSFVVEVGVPDLRRLPPGERHVVFRADDHGWGIDEYDTATQGLVSHHLRSDGTGLRHRAIPFRYVWPSELDLMARLAGMTRSERWADWQRRPFEHDSTAHVSVWRKN